MGSHYWNSPKKTLKQVPEFFIDDQIINLFTQGKQNSVSVNIRVICFGVELVLVNMVKKLKVGNRPWNLLTIIHDKITKPNEPKSTDEITWHSLKDSLKLTIENFVFKLQFIHCSTFFYNTTMR